LDANSLQSGSVLDAIQHLNCSFTILRFYLLFHLQTRSQTYKLQY